jgi:hypothetical protein
MATAVSARWPRAASAGSLGQANPQALVGQSPLPALIPVCYEQLPASSLLYASSDKIGSGTFRDQTAGKIGLDLYVRIISKPTVL